MKIIDYDTKIYPFKKIIESQLNIKDLNLLSFSFSDHNKVYRNIDTSESYLFYLYKKFAKEKLKPILGSNRILLSTPKILVAFPKCNISENFNHPLISNCYSVSIPLTDRSESNNILLSHNKKISCETNQAIIIDYKDVCFGHESFNYTNNTNLFFSFHCMSYSLYKQQNFDETYKIGDFFYLL